jgi:DNA-binding NtrC family response regulator
METRSKIQRRNDGLTLELEQGLLLVEAGPDAGHEQPLTDRPVILGRGQSADLRLSDPAVSREHVVIRPDGPRWKIEDLGSRSGTRLDGTPVEVATLTPGARVEIGDTVLVFQSETRVLQTGRAEGGERFAGMVGSSPSIQELLGLIERVGPLDLPVLLEGETGTGKERLARAVHACGSGPEGPYEVVDCTLLGEGLHLRSELFGHVKGAFSGADADRPGAFVQAHGGTVLLDEVGELPLELQPQLLRVLEEGEVRPLGGDTAVRVRVRVVAATHRSLPEMVTAGTFREDLYFRLSAIAIQVPPLRERGEDVLALASHFLPEGKQLSGDARAWLMRQSWPGNVRELEFAIQRAAALAEGEVVDVTDFAPAGTSEEPRAGDWVRVAEEAEEEAIRAALASCDGNRAEAAKLLGMSRSTLFRRLRKIRARES